MPTFDFSHMTAAEKIALADELLASIDPDDLPLTEAQAAEIDRRLATLDQDIKQGQDAFAVYEELTARYRNAG
jgi:putative addiction module component (TIGR02574 family)